MPIPPSGITTANHLPPSNPILCILFSHTSYLHVLFYFIHKSPFWSSSWPPVWQSKPHHPSTNIFIICPLYMSKPIQSGLFDFLSKTSNTCCPSDVLIPGPINPRHSKRKPQNLNLLPPVFFSVPQSLNHTTSQVSPLPYIPFISFMVKLFYHT